MFLRRWNNAPRNEYRKRSINLFMLAFIKSNYKVGDTLEITCSDGVVKGEMEYVNDRMIVIRQPNGQIYGIAASDVHSFRAECPVPIVPPATSTTQLPVYDDSDNELKDTSALPEGAGDGQTDNGNQLGLTSVMEPKVVGHIDLDKLQRIDPRFGRRKYFKREENYSASEQKDHYSYNTEADDDDRFDEEPRRDYVGAKGRITYYHPEKRYGFIRDFSSDKDLYFYIQQVVDTALYENLRKGLKVVYSIGRNAQGLVAYSLHLPHKVSDVIFLAEDQMDNGRYQFARELLMHVLEVDPDNAGAKDLLHTIEEQAPANAPRTGGHTATGEQYNPCVYYSQAKKAYLAKDYALAEELYGKAIEAGEKVESCVKDLVTLYVSNFKQAAEEDKPTMCDKAVKFLEDHRHLLADTLTTKQFLALNYYLPLLDFDSFIQVVDDILQDPQVADVVSRKVFYLWQKGIALNKMGRTEEALAVAEEGLKLAPHSRQLTNLQSQILNPQAETPLQDDETPADEGTDVENPANADDALFNE